MHAGKHEHEAVQQFVEISVQHYDLKAFEHAWKYMVKSGYFTETDGVFSFLDIPLGVEFDEYMQDLLEFGLGKYDIDFHDMDETETFCVWAQYKKEQVMELLLRNPENIQKGTIFNDDIVFAFVTVIKEENINANLKYMDGYIDPDTFQWETVANVGDSELTQLKNSKTMLIFVRKVENEDNITLPFTYIGAGQMEYKEGPRENGAHLFDVLMNETAPEDIYFDFKLPSE